jgi:hypothetical protein
MPILRRFLSLCALLFWQGGFLFYGLVVVPIGLHVLSDQLHRQGRITESATAWLNWFGLLALMLLLWDVASSKDPARWRRTGRSVSWAVIFVALAALFGLHYWLDMLDRPQGTGPTDLATFQIAHDLYLGTSALQWLAGLIYLALTVSAWRAEDGKTPLSARGGWSAMETKAIAKKEARVAKDAEKETKG